MTPASRPPTPTASASDPGADDAAAGVGETEDDRLTDHRRPQPDDARRPVEQPTAVGDLLHDAVCDQEQEWRHEGKAIVARNPMSPKNGRARTGPGGVIPELLCDEEPDDRPADSSGGPASAGDRRRRVPRTCRSSPGRRARRTPRGHVGRRAATRDQCSSTSPRRPGDRGAAGPLDRLTATGMAVAHVQRTEAFCLTAMMVPRTRSPRTTSRAAGSQAPTPSRISGRRIGRRPPDPTGGSVGRRSSASGVAAGDDEEDRSTGGGPATTPANDAAAAPSTVMPSSVVSSAWPSCSA